MAGGIAVDLPPQARANGGLLTTARILNGEWWRGIAFATGQCLPPQIVPYCQPDDDNGVEKITGNISDTATFDPFGVVQAVACSTMSNLDVDSYAIETLAATREYAIGRELANGEFTGNINLLSASSEGSSSDVIGGLSELEQAISEGLTGRLAFVHVNPGTFVKLIAAGAVYRDGTRWLTPNGNFVVSSPGYVAIPENQLHATGETYVGIGQPESLSDVNININMQAAYAEEIAVAAFDPCFNVYVEVSAA